MVLIIGASTNPERYAYLATERLLKAGFEVYLLAKREGEVFHQNINTIMPPKGSIDTVTLYIGPAHQEEYFEKIIDLSPRRVIFNPGTENAVFEEMLKNKGIDVEVNCTLVMLSLKHF